MFSPNNYYLVRFDADSLAKNQYQKANLLRFYCDIWKYDPNFKEFRRCPLCHKYFSQDEVENQNISTCRGKENNPHSEMTLVEAWTPEIVESDLQPKLLLGRDFFGAVALTPPDDQIVGFVWGYFISFMELSVRWDQESLSKINAEIPCTRVAYFQEIASDPQLRGHGIGSALCGSLVWWMKHNYPDVPSMLHTHEKSSAYPLFQKAGYQLFTHTDQINSGRILMVAKKCSDLTPENFINI